MRRLEGLEWVPRATSHMGCLEGCAKYLAMEISPGWLYGCTGYGFLIVAERDLCPSGPHSWDYIGTVSKLGRNLGLEFDVMTAYPGQPDFGQKQEEIWDAVQRAIGRGFPCYGWHHEFIVINGYDENGYLLSGPSDAPGVGAPGNWREFGASSGPGFVEVLAVQPGAAADDAEAVRDALAFAVQSAQTPGQGIAAYDNWASGLASGEEISDDGVGYHAAIWAECRTFAVDFMEEARRRLGGKCDDLFGQAIENYALVRGHLQEVSKRFPPCLAAAAPEGLTQEEAQARKGYARDQRRRNEAATFVRKAKEAEAAGLRAIEQIARTL